MFRNVRESLGMFGNVRGYLRMLGNVWESLGQFFSSGNVLECLGHI